MPGDKSDPLESRKRPPVTLWLDTEHMQEACDNYFTAYALINPSVDRADWDVAYAAAVAAFDFLMSGRMSPQR
jgi:hypothetical protein